MLFCLSRFIKKTTYIIKRKYKNNVDGARGAALSENLRSQFGGPFKMKGEGPQVVSLFNGLRVRRLAFFEKGCGFRDSCAHVGNPRRLIPETLHLGAV